MPDYRVGPVDEFAEDDRRIVVCDDREIGVFRVRGEFHAWHNRCPHQGGPVCKGRIMQRVLEPVDAEGQTRAQLYDPEESHIICPWHGYEFSIRTGQHPGNARARLIRAEVKVREGMVYVCL